MVAAIFDKLPKVARSAGKAAARYRRKIKEFQEEVEESSRQGVEEDREVSPEVLRTAKNLGIDTEGKSEKEILKDIEAMAGLEDENDSKK